MKFGVGQAVKRVEDVRLITGRGNYTSDYAPEGALHAVFLRSPHAHATFSFGDLDAARALPGVKAVYVAADLAALGDLPCLAPMANSDQSTTPLKPYPVLAKGAAHHVGDMVAMVVAESERLARDGAELLEVEWSPLPAAVDMREAIGDGAPQVFGEAPGNIAYDAHIGDKAKTEKAFAGAAHAVSLSVVNQRLVANYMEPRSAIGEYDSASGRYTLNVGSQGVHGLRDVIAEIDSQDPAR